MIEAFVDGNIADLRKKIEHKIQLLHCEYQEHQMERQLLHYRPYDDQVGTFRLFCTTATSASQR